MAPNVAAVYVGQPAATSPTTSLQSPLRAVSRWSAVPPTAVRPYYRPSGPSRQGPGVINFSATGSRAAGEALSAGYSGKRHPHSETSLMTTPSEAVEICCIRCKARSASRDIEAVTVRDPLPPESGALRISKFNPPFVAADIFLRHSARRYLPRVHPCRPLPLHCGLDHRSG